MSLSLIIGYVFFANKIKGPEYLNPDPNISYFSIAGSNVHTIIKPLLMNQITPYTKSHVICRIKMSSTFVTSLPYHNHKIEPP